MRIKTTGHNNIVLFLYSRIYQPLFTLVPLVFIATCGCSDLFEPRKPAVKQADLSVASRWDDRSFHDIIQSGGPDSIERTKQLIKDGGDLNEYRGGATPAMRAVSWGGQYNIALLLLEAGADHRLYQKKQNSRLAHLVLRAQSRLLHHAHSQRASYWRLYRWLEKHGESFDAIEKDLDRWKSWGNLPYDEIGRRRRQEIADRLAKEVASGDAGVNDATLQESSITTGRPESRQGDTPLHAAVREQDVERVRQLIKQGADLNQLNAALQTPVTLAVSSGRRFDIALMLLKAGADPSVDHSLGTTSLIHSVVMQDRRRMPSSSEQELQAYMDVLRWLEEHGESFEQARQEILARRRGGKPNAVPLSTQVDSPQQPESPQPNAW